MFKYWSFGFSLILPLVVCTNTYNVGGVKKVNATNENFIAETNENYLPFSEKYFRMEGNLDFYIEKRSARFGENKYPYLALDDFYGGNHGQEDYQTGENEKGIFISSSWRQDPSTPYIGFTLGGHIDNYVSLVFECIDENGEYLTETINISTGDKVKEDESDTGANKGIVGNTSWMMMPRFAKMPDKFVNGATVHAELHQNASNTLNGAMVFGGLQVNLTPFDCAEIANMSTMIRPDNSDESPFYTYKDAGYDRINRSFNALGDTEYAVVYQGYSEGPSDHFYNEDFEDDSWFLKWQPLQVFASLENYNSLDSISDALTSSIDNMPYNQTGKRFFRTNREINNDGDNKGKESGFIADGDNKIFVLASKAFIIDSDFMSVKLSGNEFMFQLADADETFDLATIQESFDVSSLDTTNISKCGIAPVTMRRYIINTSGYRGNKVRFLIAKFSTSEYSSFNMDDIITQYDTNTFSFGLETFNQTNDSGNFYGALLDKYIVPETYYEGSKIYVDNVPEFKEAYDFLDKYYSILRSKEKGSSFCDMLISEETKQILKDYNALSDKAASIVDRSMDYNHGNKSTPTTWFENPVNIFPISQSIDYLFENNKMVNAHSSSFGGILNNNNNNEFLYPMVAGAFVFGLIIVAMFAIKTKQKEEK